MNGGLRRHEVVLAFGALRRYDPVEWRDALVLVEHGEVELETVGGACRRFAAGAVLCFTGLPLRLLRNVGPGHVTLVAVSRRGSDSFSGGPPSHGRTPSQHVGNERGAHARDR